MTSKQTSTPSGIITKDNGERVIPASKRPDGTIRAERKVRPGYIPPEDVPLYRNKYVQENVTTTSTTTTNKTPEQPKTKAQRKNEKRNAKNKEARNKLNSNNDNDDNVHNNNVDVDELENKLKDMKIRPLDNDQVNIHNNNNKVDDNKGEMLSKEELIEMNKKKIKALEKKIRQIERIKEKQNKGENLITDEHEKLKKLEPFKEELNKLLNEIKEQEGEGKKGGSGKGDKNGKKNN